MKKLDKKQASQKLNKLAFRIASLFLAVIGLGLMSRGAIGYIANMSDEQKMVAGVFITVAIAALFYFCNDKAK